MSHVKHRENLCPCGRGEKRAGQGYCRQCHAEAQAKYREHKRELSVQNTRLVFRKIAKEISRERG